ncbi:hypothetical protein F5Y17DRAFT_435003 [Xylariaceae sp. FL0594]|nr:hypothetical protein F5Y17DRAFT_435003 [Xylariaceae sp. FL0594]
MRPLFIHPDVRAQMNHQVPVMEHAHRRCYSPSSSVADDASFSSSRNTSCPSTTGITADMRVSLATNQLKDQVKENISLCRELLDEYTNEVDLIKQYIGPDILENIWRSKIKFIDKRKDGQENTPRFALQKFKLESCLGQVDDAMRMLLRECSSDRRSGKSRRYQWEKERASWKLLTNLSAMSTKSETACRALLNELVELQQRMERKNATDSTSASSAKRESNRTNSYGSHRRQREQGSSRTSEKSKKREPTRTNRYKPPRIETEEESSWTAETTKKRKPRTTDRHDSPRREEEQESSWTGGTAAGRRDSKSKEGDAEVAPHDGQNEETDQPEPKPDANDSIW